MTPGMPEATKKMMQDHLQNLEEGFSQAIAQGAFKNLKYASQLQRSMDILNAYFETVPVVKSTNPTTPISNGKGH